MFPLYLTGGENGDIGINLFDYFRPKINGGESYELSTKEEVYVNSVKVIRVAGLSYNSGMLILQCESYVADVVYLYDTGYVHLMYA